jgi:hypothetical protein
MYSQLIIKYNLFLKKGVDKSTPFFYLEHATQFSNEICEVMT